MKTNKIMAKILSGVIISSLIFPSSTYAAGGVYKDETVYVNLDNAGKDIDKSSSIRLYSDTPLKKIEDESILKEVTNVKGDEVPDILDGKMIWETDEKNLYYQGKVEKELPIKAEIEYCLDGEKVDIENIAGESGELKINISIENIDKRPIIFKNGEKREGYAPYIVATSVILSMDKFENVEMNTGKLVSDGSNQILSFISLPGLEESLNIGEDIIDIPTNLELKADVVDFEMLPIVFTATSEIPELEDLDLAKDLDELLDGIDSIVDAGEKLNDATEKLYDGQGELNTGINELINGVDQIKEGTNPLLDGSSKLGKGIDSAYKGSLDINKGTSILSKSANQLGEGFIRLGDGTIEYSNKALEFSQGANKIAKGVESIPESTSALSGGMEELIKGTETVKNGQDSLTNGLDKSLDALAQIKTGKEKEAEIVGILLNGMDGFDNIVKALESIPGGEDLAGSMGEGLEKRRMALEGIQNSSGELIGALSQLEVGLKEAETASKELSQGVENINAGQRELGDGLNKLDNGAKELQAASKELEEGSIGLEKGAKSINQNALLAKEGVDKFTAGGRDLAKGTNDLSNGLGELNNGANQLNDGVSELSKGSNKLSKGGGELKKGSEELTKGSKELNEGMGEFYEKGRAKMNDEINNSNFNIEDTLEIKDGLVNIAKDNKSFTGISKDMDGNLKFIMKTEGVRMEEEENKLDMIEEVEEKNGFINWIKGLFK